jgi:hypothetical protein
MTLLSSTSQNLTLTIYVTLYCNIMKSQRTGRGQFSLELLWIGTIKRTCEISMPGYITNVLNKFQHETPGHLSTANMQFATQDNSPPLNATQCTEIHKITGSVLYYSRAVDPTVIMALNDIATEQTVATEKTKTAAGQLLDYLATHPNANIRFQASDMILHIHSDASYLSVSKERNRLGGLFYLGYNPPIKTSSMAPS